MSSASLLDFLKRNSLFIAFIILILFIALIVLIQVFFLPEQKNIDEIYGDDEIVMHYFHNPSCPNCLAQVDFLEELVERYPNLNVHVYMISDPKTMEIYEDFAERIEGLGREFPGTPLTIVGDEYNVGFRTDETTGNIIESMVALKQEQIDSNWDNSTMNRTKELRNSYID